jgi:hypothetical protein
MAQLELTPTTLIVHITGLDKLWTLTSRLDIPLAHITGATLDPALAAAGPPGWWRGAYVPGVLAAGSFATADGRVFWAVHDPAHAIVIQLTDETYKGLGAFPK